MARKKPDTAQLRLAVDVIEDARIIAAFHSQQPGDFLSDYLRPKLAELKRQLIVEQARALTSEDPDTPAKGRKGK